jgi:hypothetical protein
MGAGEEDRPTGRVNGARNAALTAALDGFAGTRHVLLSAAQRERERCYTLHLDFAADTATAARELAEGLGILCPEVQTYSARLSTGGRWSDVEPVFCMADGPDQGVLRRCRRTSGLAHRSRNQQAAVGPGRYRRDKGMTATTYYAMTADEQLAAAQRTLDTHITSSATGRCLECGTLGPCCKRENAVVIFSRTVRLPRRQPGATRPELLGARRVDASDLG